MMKFSVLLISWQKEVSGGALIHVSSRLEQQLRQLLVLVSNAQVQRRCTCSDN